MVSKNLYETLNLVTILFLDESTLLQYNDNVTMRKKDKNIISSNRLSIVSSESDKKSSESVEVLSNTECTTSPDSDALSLGQSLSTSSG